MPMSPRMKAKKGRFGFAGLAPRVQITSPVTGFSVASAGSPAAGSVDVTGTAYDDLQGDISASIVWTSSLDGAVGSGASATLSLSVGTHVITATASSAGSPTSSGTDTITVIVT